MIVLYCVFVKATAVLLQIRLTGMRRLAVNLSFLCLEMHILYMDIPEHNVLC